MRRTIFLLLAVSLFHFAIQAQSTLNNKLRGTWITNVASDAMLNKKNVEEAVLNCKRNGLTDIFVVVWNNGLTTYPSKVVEKYIGIKQDPRYKKFDPIASFVSEGHKHGLKVHAWFEYGFSSSYSANGGSIVAAKPEWAAKDLNNQLVVKNGFDWLNGLHPQVQQFMVDLFKEVVNKYNVDGVQGDDRLPAMPSTGGYDAYTVNLYKSENGGANPPPSPTDAGWLKWRADKLNVFLKRLRTEVKAIKPTILFTMSPSPYPFGYTEYLQDWPTWVDSAWVDAIIPQIYRYNITDYDNSINQQKSYYKNMVVDLNNIQI